MKTEWWYDDATFHASQETKLVLARLSAREGATAQILTDGPERLEFAGEDEAIRWLLDEEYRRLADLIQDRDEDGPPRDPRIKVPEAGGEEEMARHMVIDLAPGVSSARSHQPGMGRRP